MFLQTNKSSTCKAKKALTYLAVSITFILHRVRLIEFVLQLLDQIVLRVHDIQVLVFMPIPFIFLVLAGAADVIEDLPQFVSLGWTYEKHRLLPSKKGKQKKRQKQDRGKQLVWLNLCQRHYRLLINTKQCE